MFGLIEPAPSPSTRKSILLIHPPLFKPCEAPAGPAKLAGAFRLHGAECRIYDANILGIGDLLKHPVSAEDTWSERAVRNLGTHLQALRTPKLYTRLDAYKRAVMDVNRVLQITGRRTGVALSLSNCTHPELSPVRSGDLIQAAERFAGDPFYPSFKQRLTDLFAEKEPHIIGISINYMSQALCAFAMAGFIRSRWPAARIVFGGGLVTSWMSIPGFSNPFRGVVDHLVSGPGEAYLLELCGVGGRPPSREVRFDYSGFEMNRYLSPGAVLPVSTARGCWWRKCTFCPEQAEKGRYRPHGVKAVMGDLERSVSGMSPVLVHFLDNALAPGFMKRLIRHPPGVPWYGFARITLHLTDPDFAAGLRASGCVMLKLGVESGDPAVLEALGKGVSPDLVSRALKNLKAAGIATYVYLLFGTPAEDEESARMTLDFTAAHGDAIDFLNLAVFNLPAHGREAGRLDTVDFYGGDLSLYREFRHPKGWDRNRVRRFLAKEFTRNRSVRPILAADPPFFTSNHAPFFRMP